MREFFMIGTERVEWNLMLKYLGWNLTEKSGIIWDLVLGWNLAENFGNLRFWTR
jgi:hypothetical protein